MASQRGVAAGSAPGSTPARVRCRERAGSFGGEARVVVYGLVAGNAIPGAEVLDC